MLDSSLARHIYIQVRMDVGKVACTFQVTLLP